MKSTIFAVVLAAFVTGAHAEDTKTMCPEDCAAYLASPDKDKLTLADIQQMCSPIGSTVRLVVDCSDKTE